MSTAFGVPETLPAGGGGNYKPVPADNHPGVCIGVIDLGTHMESYQGGEPSPKRKIKLQFELPECLRDNGQTHVVSATYTYSLHEKANFRKTLDNWLGKDWPERYRGQSWEFLLDMPAMVNTEQGPSRRDPKQIVSWIASLSKMPRGMPRPKATRSTLYQDLSTGVLIKDLGVRDAEMIRQSLEYQRGDFRDEAPRPDPKYAGASKPTEPIPVQPVNEDGDGDEDEDEDTPF